MIITNRDGLTALFKQQMIDYFIKNHSKIYDDYLCSDSRVPLLDYIIMKFPTFNKDWKNVKMDDIFVNNMFNELWEIKYDNNK